MNTSVVVVNWNSGDLLRSCVASLLAAEGDIQIVVVDNGSSDASLEALAPYRDRIDFVGNSVNRGLAAAINQGVAVSHGGYVLLLNPDLRVVPGALDLLEQVLSSNARAGAVGGFVNQQYLPRELPTAVSLARENLGFKRALSLTMSAPTVVGQPAAAALLVRRDVFDEVGGFDERFFPAWYEDVDFCQRVANAGWDIYFEPRAMFQHDGGYSAARLGRTAFASAYYRNQLRYADKHLRPASRLAVRASLVAGMLARAALRPSEAGACLAVLKGVMRQW